MTRARERSGFTLTTDLHEAARTGDTARIAELIARGADPNARDGDGKTPLHYAARWGQSPDIVTALLERGADSQARDQEGNTPLELARELRNTAAAASEPAEPTTDSASSPSM